jgi:putative FmdB family regulatory protein
MPRYDFICTGCKTTFDKRMKVSELFPGGVTEAVPPACEKCGAQLRISHSAPTLRMGAGGNDASTTPKKFRTEMH